VNINPVFGFVKLVRFSWSTAAILIKKKCVQIKWSDQNDDEEFNEDFDQEDNDICEISEENVKKEASKTKPAKPKPSKKHAAAVLNEKNNSTILNFFQKPQKRTITTANSTITDITSQFFVNKNLKFCTNL
jgi:hypothetical protein